jgi:membrane associated rhomboid family serine protease
MQPLPEDDKELREFFKTLPPELQPHLGSTPFFTYIVAFLILLSAVIQIILALFNAKMLVNFTYLNLWYGLVTKMPWTLITHIFLHSTPEHLIYNLIALCIFGTHLEMRIGPKQFILIFLISGLIAGLCSAIFSGPKGRAIGASGAILGIFGCYAMIDPDRIVFVSFIFPVKVFYLFMLYLVIDYVALVQQTKDNIGHMAHLSGAIAGIIYGLYVYGGLNFTEKDERRFVPLTLVFAFICIIFYFVADLSVCKYSRNLPIEWLGYKEGGILKLLNIVTGETIEMQNVNFCKNRIKNENECQNIDCECLDNELVKYRCNNLAKCRLIARLK